MDVECPHRSLGFGFRESVISSFLVIVLAINDFKFWPDSVFGLELVDRLVWILVVLDPFYLFYGRLVVDEGGLVFVEEPLDLDLVDP